MNRKNKSSLILVIVAICVAPLLILAFQYANLLDDKVEKLSKEAEVMMNGVKTETKKNLLGKWSDDKNTLWYFSSDTKLIRSGETNTLRIELNVIFINEKEVYIVNKTSDTTILLKSINQSLLSNETQIIKLKKAGNKI